MSASEAAQAPEACQAARGQRIEALAVVLIALGVLIVARLLTPDPSGLGTHEQLLFVPCAFHWITGLPCPMCGMTTAFALMARGEVLAALQASVLGPPLYVATWLLGARALVMLARGGRGLPAWLAGASGARGVLLLIGAGWLVNIALRLTGF